MLRCPAFDHTLTRNRVNPPRVRTCLMVCSDALMSAVGHVGLSIDGTGSMKATTTRTLLCGLFAVLLLASLITLARNNLGYQGMWWDEAAQFWISQGLSNYAQPFAAPRSVRHVIRMNNSENLDPGGFSLLLHLWTRAGKGLKWLRSLPFLFFVLGATSLGLLGCRLSRSVSFALTACMVPLLYPGVIYFGFEIRAYSMEMAGIAFGTLMFVHALKKPSFARLSLLGLACAAFLSSRYSYIFFIAAFLCAWWYASSRRQDDLWTRSRQLLVILLPVLAAGIAIAYVTLYHQLRPEMRGAPLGIAAPIYTRASVLGSVSDLISLLQRNFLSLPALPITAAVIAFLFLRRPVYKALARHRGSELDRVRVRFGALYVIILSIQAISIIVSLLGYYPWDISSRWSAYLLMVSLLSAVILSGEITVVLRHAISLRTDRVVFKRRATQVGVLILLLVATCGFYHSIHYRQTIEAPYPTNVALQLLELPVASLRDRSVFVAFYEVPMVRYLYEYGPYAGCKEYPRLFRFESYEEWHKSLPIDATLEGIEFIVSALSLDEASARFPGYTLRRMRPEGSRLLRVSRTDNP